MADVIRTAGATTGSSSTIAAAITWLQSNYTMGTDDIGSIELVDSQEFNESNLTLGGFTGTPSITSYPRVITNPSVRHAGVAGTGHARVRGSTNGQNVFVLNTDFAALEYLEIQQDTTGSSDEAVRISSGVTNFLISRCILWSNQNIIDQDGVYAGNYAVSGSIDNCIIYGWHRSGIYGQNHSGTATQTFYIDFCTVSKCGDEQTDNSGGISARCDDTGAIVNMNIYNTASVDNDDEDYNDDVSGGGLGVINWAGTHNADGDGTLSSQAGLTASNQTPLVAIATTQTTGSFFVVNSITAPEDYLLLDDANGNLVSETGLNRVASEPDARQDFSLDIAGNTRSTTSPSPDIGASEYTAGGITVTPGLSTETDTAQTTTPLRIKTAGLATSAETAFGISSNIVYSVGFAVESNSSFSVAINRTLSTGLSTETEAAQALTINSTKSVGLSAEVETAQVLTINSTKSVGLSTETETAQAITTSSTIAVGLSAETETAQALTINSTKSVGLSAEIDTSNAVGVSGAITVGMSSETETSQALTIAKNFTVGQTAETDLSQTITGQRTYSAGQSSEVDSSFAVALGNAVVAGLVSETDAALSISMLRAYTLGIANETDSSLNASTVEQSTKRTSQGNQVLITSREYNQVIMTSREYNQVTIQ